MFILAGTISPKEVLEMDRITEIALQGMKYRELYTSHLWQYMVEELKINEWEKERILEAKTNEAKLL